MALDIVQPASVQERPHHRGRRQCSCCPYGYHIDLDFVRYCESITNAQLMPSVSIKRSKWNNARRKRASREALLGLVNSQSSELERIESPTAGPIYIGDELQKAVLDFEKTLKHASLPRMNDKKDWNGFDSIEYNHPKNRGTHTSHTLPRHCGKGNRDGANVISPLPIEEMLFASANSNNNIREQIAASLRRMKELEDNNKQIPRLNDKIGFLNRENEKLRKELRSKEALHNTADQVGELMEENDLLKKEIRRLESKKVDLDQLNILREENEKLRVEIRQRESSEMSVKTSALSSDKLTSTSDLVHSRAAAVGCTVLTRDVGISTTSHLTLSIGVGTEPKPEPRLSKVEPVSLDKIIGKCVPTNHKTIGVNAELEKLSDTLRPEMQNASTSTDLKMSEVVSRSDMHSKIEELKKKSVAPPKASIRVNTHLHHNQIFTQNDLDDRVTRFAKTYETNFLRTNLPKKPTTVNSFAQTASKPEQKHIGLQFHAKMCEVGVSAMCPKSTQGVQVWIHTKDVGVSEDSTVPEICEKCRVKRTSVGTLFPDKSDQLLQRLNSSTEISISKKDSRSRSTDTRELNLTKDAGVNTAKTDLVAKAVETGDYSCNKCSSHQGTLSTTYQATGLPTYHITSQTTSRLTFPVKPLPAKRPSYLPISVSRAKLPSTPSPQPQKLQPEESNSDSGSDDGTYTIHQDVEANVSDEPFQDLSLKPRSFPSASRREPSKEMRGAMKVLNDALLKSPGGDIPKHVKTAVNIVQQEWFKVSSVASANPLDVEYYLDCFEEISGTLLEYVVNMPDVSGNTAMHYAVSNGNFDVVSILLDSKVCNINKLNTAGYTCIMLVALTKVKSETDREVVRRLFHMADVNIRAKEHGQTALMLAVSHGRIDTVELLLEAGADINIQDEDGSTALMCAAEHGYIEIVKLLLAQPDCDLSIADCDGTTALAIAMEAGNRDIGVLLYAQEHFSRGSSPYTSLKSKRAKSTTPTIKGSRPSTPSHSSHKRDSDVLEPKDS